MHILWIFFVDKRALIVYSNYANTKSAQLGGMKMSVGKKLRALRGGKTQKEVAADLNITKSALAMYERDERVPRDEIKVRIAEYYGESVQSLFYAN